MSAGKKTAQISRFGHRLAEGMTISYK